LLQRFRLDFHPGARVDRYRLGAGGALRMAVHPQDRRFARVRIEGNVRELVDLD
ncbi:MAG: cytochrome P450, partial [Gemmatimonadetes bacterium]|nr:cytochrome P450 [Gemmatimonadota bacterium]